MGSSAPSLLSLPPEVTEHVLILAALHGFPFSIAAVSQTCKILYELVYESSDHHLWREVFLAIFDDPRRVKDHLNNIGISQSSCDNFNWFKEFRERILAANYVRRYTRPESDPPSASAVTRSIHDPSRLLLCTLRSLNSLISTSLPFPPSPTIAFGTIPTSSLSPFPNYPAFPPLVLLAASAYPIPDVFRSRNAEWLEDVLRRGFPPALTRRLLANPEPDDDDYWQDDDELTVLQTGIWGDSEESRLFYKLICCTGFLPMPQAETDNLSADSLVLPALPLERRRLSTERQLSLTRRFARITVYNLRYLWRDRAWGPFLPIATEGEAERDDEPMPEGDAADDLVPLIVGDENAAGHESAGASVDPRVLRPDWKFLACVRVLVEANLTEMLRETPWEDPDSRLRMVGSALKRLEIVRMGGAPGFWKGWSEKSQRHKECDGDEQQVMVECNNDGKVDGWDWAGVEGEWKRCICWLDYRDLLVHNLHSGPTRFNDDSLEEVIRIIPMTLRITGYSRPFHSPSTPEEARWPPIIHVEGENAGPPLENNSTRKIKGTVSLIADGAVRWSLVSSRANGVENEWASEGVQIGGIGSAAGLLGLWTGADHERTDPLGPFWAWKVA